MDGGFPVSSDVFTQNTDMAARFKNSLFIQFTKKYFWSFIKRHKKCKYWVKFDSCLIPEKPCTLIILLKMTKRKLGGPASARNKQKKIREEAAPKSSKENKDKNEEEAKETPAIPAIEIKKEIEDVVDVEENTNTSNIIGKLLEDGDEEISGDETEVASNSRDGVEGKTRAESLVQSLRQDLSRKAEEVKKLQNKVSSLESQNQTLSGKYKKYKDMSVTLRDNDKRLLEENRDLKEKLKNYVENLQEEQESKTDVGSKLALKDVMLQKERTKFEELERKFKSFLKIVNEKSDRMPDTFVAKVKTSLEQTNISDHLTDKTIVPEFTKRMDEKLRERKDANQEVKTKETSKAPERRDPPVSSQSKKVVESSPVPPATASPALRTNRRNCRVNLTKVSSEDTQPDSQPAPSTPSTPSTELSATKPRSNRGRRTRTVPAPSSAPRAISAQPALPSKLLANSSISIGKQTTATKSIEVNPEVNPPPSAASSPALSKLNKLKNSTLSISSPTPAPPSKPPAAIKSSGISLTRSGEQAEAQKSSPVTTDSLKQLKSSGISFSKVNNSSAAKITESPSQKPPSGRSRMEALKKLNISVGRSSEEEAAPAPENSMSLAIIPPSGVSTKSAKKSSKAGSKRGPASAKRKYSKKQEEEEEEEEEEEPSGRQLALTSSVPEFFPAEAEVSLNLSDDLAVESVLGDTSEELLSITVDEDFMKGLAGPEHVSKYDNLIEKIENELENVSQIRSEDEEDPSERLLAE